jgi:phage FluMu protein Com
VARTLAWPDDGDLEQWRCSRCNRLLGRFRWQPGCAAEIKCYNCHTFNAVRVPRLRLLPPAAGADDGDPPGDDPPALPGARPAPAPGSP